MVTAMAGLSRAVMVWLVLAGSSAAQTVSGLSGRVVDARTGQALAGALVRVEHQPAFAETAADGSFRLDLAPGSHTVIVSLVGFAEARKDVAIAAAQVLELVVELSEGAGQYEERIVVTGATSGVGEAPGAAVLHGRDLQALRGVMLDDPLRAVQALPAATSTDDFYSEFAVRGTPFRQVGLAVDGIPSPFLIHTIHGITDGGSIAMVNSEALGAATLLPGGYPQRHGRRLGAHIDLTTRDGNRDAFHGRAGLSGTSANAIAEGPLANGRGSWLVSARRSYLDYLLARIDPEGSFGFGFSDGLAKVTLDLGPRHQLRFLNIAGRSTFDEAVEDLSANDQALAKSHAWLSALTWRFTPSPRWSVAQHVYATGMGFNNVNSRDEMLERGRDRIAAWRVDATAAFEDRWIAELGADLQHVSHALAQQRTFDNTITPATLTDYAAASRSASAFARLSARFGRLSLSPGARVDYAQHAPRTTVSPWMNTEVAIGPATRIRGGVGLYRQPPELSYRHGVRANPSLADERAVHADVTLSHTMPLSLAAQVTVYARGEDDVLRAVGAEPRRLSDDRFTLGRGDARWENRLSGEARGIEASLRRDAPNGMSGWIAYAFSRHRYSDEQAPEEFWSDYDQRHTFSAYVLTRLSNRTSIGAKFRYGSNYPMTGYLGEEPFSPNAPALFGGMQPLFLSLATERNRLRLPAYARLDVRADRAMVIAGRQVTLFVEVANALNRRNERNVPYSVQRDGRVSGATDSLLPIVPSAGFVIEF
ncbi:MAG TPA: TonB-dependent receptor [Vicinamibacterales bacterium]|nr:TonB-dependent receptor [Vicinamibacterales bacterium]